MASVDLKELMIQKIREIDPTIDTSDVSVFSDLCVRPLSGFLSSVQTMINRDEVVRDIRRFKEMLPEEIDSLAANFFVSRKTGEFSRGTVSLFLSSPRDIIIPLAQQFFSSNRAVFISTEVIRATKSQVAVNFDRIRNAYRVDVPVRSVATGSDFNASIGDIIEMAGQPSDIVTVTNMTEFSKSIPRETDEQLVNRIISSASMRNLCSADSSTALLSEDDRVSAVSVIGAGDAEMLRDIVFGVHTGGAQDTYVYSQEEPQVYIKDLPITSSSFPMFTFYGPNISGTVPAGGGFVLPEYLAENSGPVIFVSKVEYGTGIGTTFSVSGEMALGEDYVHEFIGTGSINNKNSIQEAWRLRVIRQPATTTQTIRITAIRVPLISALQTEFAEAGTRAPAQTTLFRAFTPVTINVKAIVSPGVSGSRNVDDYVNAIKNVISSQAVVDRIDASDFITALENAGADRVELPITITGRALYPDLAEAEMTFDESAKLLSIERPEVGATVRTMAIYSGDIQITLI